METPTIVKQTKSYMLVKIPLPRMEDAVFASPAPRITKSERAFLQILQRGEKEYQEGKTISASSIDKAMRIYAKRKKNKKN